MLKLRRRATHHLVLALLAAPIIACSPGAEAQAPGAAAVQQEAAASEAAATTEAPAYVDNSTAGVAQRHFKVFGEGNLEALLADYDDAAVLFTPQGAVKGKEALSAHFTARLAEFGQAGTSLLRDDLRVRDETAYITWSGETADNKYPVATDTFVVKEGKIVAHTFAAKIIPKTPAKEAPAAGKPDALPDTPTGAVLRHHLEAIEKGQLDELLVDYTTDSLILTQKGKKSGKSGVKEVFSGFLEEFKAPKLKFKVKTMLVEGEMAYVVWSAKSADDPYGFATETLVIRDGKVVSQTVTLGLK